MSVLSDYSYIEYMYINNMAIRDGIPLPAKHTMLCRARYVVLCMSAKWYVVLGVFCVVYVGKPPTTHVGGVKWYVVLEVFCVVYVGKPPTTHVGGVKWYVVLEAYRHTQHKIPPTRHTIGVSCM